MNKAAHFVTFSAQPDGFVARCECGWEHTWLPWDDILERGYAVILAIGLDHARQDEPLPSKPNPGDNV